jgi:hypothetical protein
MTFRTVLLAAGAAMMLSMSSAAFAQEPAPARLAETQAKLRVATGVIALGRADEDPMMLVVGARILSGIGSGIGAVEGEESANPAYDVAAILDEARQLAGDDQYLLDAIAAASAGPAERRAGGERNCEWHQVQGAGSDPFAWEWVMVCY